MGKLKNIVLGSASESRASVLKNAGLNFEIDPADIDEDEIKSKCLKEGMSATTLAAKLAETKALVVSSRWPDSLIIGGDQILVFDGELFKKPLSLAEASANLQRFRGNSHNLVTAICVAHSGIMEWTYTETVEMKMREFSDEFLENYLNKTGDSILSSVGGYKIEEHGVQLFTQIKGSYFTVLGVPLFPLLAHLQITGAIKA